MAASAFVRQFLVVAAPLLVALSVGGTIGYPNLLLQQLKANSSSINLDLETSSWIGSIHGFASIPSFLMPSLMQWKGRKISFLLSCSLVTLGWILLYSSQSISTILFSESLHGLGSQCVLIVSLCSISELVSPSFRNISVTFYGLWQSVGIAAAAIIGQYCHWKTTALIMLMPSTLGILTALLMWPESPSWLALQGRYQECERNFKWLRGEGVKANKELIELLLARKELKEKVSLFEAFVSRDFYVPAMLIILLLSTAYWSGLMVLIVYSPLVVKKTSNNDDIVHIGVIAINIFLIAGYISCSILMRTKINNKIIILTGVVAVIFSSMFCFVTTLLQHLNVLTDSVLCLCGLVFYIFIGFGLVMPSAFAISTEIIAVKYRGLGGALHVIVSSLLHFSSLKLAPYMFEYLHLWGTFLVYSINTTVCGILIWIFVPETKNRTLLELEDYFNHGRFIKRSKDDTDIRMVELA